MAKRYASEFLYSKGIRAPISGDEETLHDLHGLTTTTTDRVDQFYEVSYSSWLTPTSNGGLYEQINNKYYFDDYNIIKYGADTRWFTLDELLTDISDSSTGIQLSMPVSPSNTTIIVADASGNQYDALVFTDQSTSNSYYLVKYMYSTPDFRWLSEMELESHGLHVYTDDLSIPLCFTNINESGKSSVTLRDVGTFSDISYEISYDNISWEPYSFYTEIDLSNHGDKVYFRGHRSTQSRSTRIMFSTTGTLKVSGNIHSLLSETDFKDIYDLTPYGTYTFYDLFYNCNAIVNAPALPATTLTTDCYSEMFAQCANLTHCSSGLPASDIPAYSYSKMFYNSGLVECPEIEATSAQQFACSQMFAYCVNLTTSMSILNFASMSQGSCSSMFSGCTKLTSTPELPCTYLTMQCYQNMFNGCTSLTSTPDLQAESLQYNCYAGMFKDCSNLRIVNCTAKSNSSSTTDWLSGVSPTGIFYGYDKSIWEIDSPNGIPAGWSFADGTLGMPFCIENIGSDTARVRLMNNGMITASTYKYSLNSIDWYQYSYGNNTYLDPGDKFYIKGGRGGPQSSSRYTQFSITGSNVKVSGNIYSLLTDTDFDKITDLTPYGSYTFYCMFYNCTTLTNMPMLPATTLTDHCYNDMFNGCTNLNSISELPALTMADECYRAMFANCSGLLEMPSLPATTLANGCYRSMFYNCTNLNTVRCNAQYNISGNTVDWLLNVSPTGTFYGYKQTDWTVGASGLPTGWTFIGTIPVQKVGEVNFNSQWYRANSANVAKYGVPDDSYTLVKSFSNKGIDNTSASMTITINNTEDLNFTYGVWPSSEYAYDYLTVYVDGSARRSFNQQVYSWEMDTIQLSPGTTELTFTYKKDSSVSQQDDCAYVALPTELLTIPDDAEPDTGSEETGGSEEDDDSYLGDVYEDGIGYKVSDSSWLQPDYNINITTYSSGMFRVRYNETPAYSDPGETSLDFTRDQLLTGIYVNGEKLADAYSPSSTRGKVYRTSDNSIIDVNESYDYSTNESKYLVKNLYGTVMFTWLTEADLSSYGYSREYTFEPLSEGEHVFLFDTTAGGGDIGPDDHGSPRIDESDRSELESLGFTIDSSGYISVWPNNASVTGYYMYDDFYYPDSDFYFEEGQLYHLSTTVSTASVRVIVKEIKTAWLYNTAANQESGQRQISGNSSGTSTWVLYSSELQPINVPVGASAVITGVYLANGTSLDILPDCEIINSAGYLRFWYKSDGNTIRVNRVTYYMNN